MCPVLFACVRSLPTTLCVGQTQIAHRCAAVRKAASCAKIWIEGDGLVGLLLTQAESEFPCH